MEESPSDWIIRVTRLPICRRRQPCVAADGDERPRASTLEIIGSSAFAMEASKSRDKLNMPAALLEDPFMYLDELIHRQQRVAKEDTGLALF